MNRKEAHEHLIAMYESYLEKVPMLIAEKAFDYFENLLERDTPIPIGYKKCVSENYGVISESYTCPRCEKEIYEEEQRYCDFCGQRLKWSE